MALLHDTGHPSFDDRVVLSIPSDLKILWPVAKSYADCSVLLLALHSSKSMIKLDTLGAVPYSRGICK